ncbi:MULTISPECIES: YiiD C-terminal domain-containing protein [Halomonadaceae]|uniref:YiiD C-terminal domain-containing protein n=1 Tax=Halomonadaceae TaxID=28256 RepID=UPI0015999886|nr:MULTISPECIES: YiiD C-terminal domain-containing protein [Halomonas]QJQ94952.1 thioesterase [Halomonas sp. PA5]
MRQTGEHYPRLPLPERGSIDDLVAFQRWLEQAIPQVEHLGISAMRWEGGILTWQLSLEASLNDKGTGFGGALASQSALIGWCWATLWLRSLGRNQDVVIAEASQRFRAPVRGDYRFVCRPLDEYSAPTLAQRLDERGKGRITLVQHLYCDETHCMEACGDYVILPGQ